MKDIMLNFCLLKSKSNNIPQWRACKRFNKKLIDLYICSRKTYIKQEELIAKANEKILAYLEKRSELKKRLYANELKKKRFDGFYLVRAWRKKRWYIYANRVRKNMRDYVFLGREEAVKTWNAAKINRIIKEKLHAHNRS